MSAVTDAFDERVLVRRYPAWTLYARAFAGNRLDADVLVRDALRKTHGGAARHEDVLDAIRRQALARGASGLDAAPSALDALRQDARPAMESAYRRLRRMPRPQRRAMELLFSRRPPLLLHQVADRLGEPIQMVEATVEAALRKLPRGKA